MTRKVPRIMISALKSGGGKTTAACGLLAALKARGRKPCGIKCGPDYIDPLFFERICGRRGNIDLFLAEKNCAGILAHDAEGADIAVVEGAMGYFDGLGANSAECSSYALARELGIPVALVVDMGGRALSACAEVIGAMAFCKPDKIRAVILNKCSPALYSKVAPKIQDECGIEVLGFIPNDKRIEFSSRHLGLYTPDSIPEFDSKIEILAELIEENVNLDALEAVASSASDLDFGEDIFAPRTDAPSPAIAVARDEAFCFYYRENLDLLSAQGARLLEFSPLRGEGLPSGADALYLGGGYPELFKDALLANTEFNSALRRIVQGKTMSVLAECGGFMYLQMIGAIEGRLCDKKRLVRFGYCQLLAGSNSFLLNRGESVPAHEFHHFDSTNNGTAFAISKKSGESWRGGFADKSLLALWPHLFFPSMPALAERFVLAASEKAPFDAAQYARARWTRLAKPLGGLGLLEDLVVRLCAASGTARPPLNFASRPALAIFCADNGIVEEGVSQSGQEVTGIVARNMEKGLSSACIMARCAGAEVFVTDVGIAPNGTKNFLKEDAMSRERCEDAFGRGLNLAHELAGRGFTLLLAGEMGIGNTTTSSAVASVLLGAAPKKVTGRGAGLDDERLERKISAIRRGIELRRPNPDDALDVLCKVGGLDIAAMAGFFCGAAEARVPAVADGLVSSVAALCAERIRPGTARGIVASHAGSEPACRLIEAALHEESGFFRPIIHAQMHLGEGTGAVALVPLVKMACEVYNGLPEFEEVGIEQYEDFGSRRP